MEIETDGLTSGLHPCRRHTQRELYYSIYKKHHFFKTPKTLFPPASPTIYCELPSTNRSFVPYCIVSCRFVSHDSVDAPKTKLPFALITLKKKGAHYQSSLLAHRRLTSNDYVWANSFVVVITTSIMVCGIHIWW